MTAADEGATMVKCPNCQTVNTVQAQQPQNTGFLDNVANRAAGFVQPGNVFGIFNRQASPSGGATLTGAPPPMYGGAPPSMAAQPNTAAVQPCANAGQYTAQTC